MGGMTPGGYPEGAAPGEAVPTASHPPKHI